MEQNLRGLFERALDDEPGHLPGDTVRLAMVHGRRIRRRRGLVAGGLAATAAVVTAVVAVNGSMAPAPDRVPAAAARPSACTQPAQDRASDVAVFLTPDITATQRSGLLTALQADPVVRDVQFESREQAYARFKELWQKSPDFVSSLSGDALPESFRMALAQPSGYPAFAARFRHRAGVQDVVGYDCPRAGR
ncbi:permease-like cell division protein FtsX [Actinoplanes sp. N902-109]|uniref:permease-like cell division protein FtsX n=1 Tax=Actinoplanes sp. (strain N902-109) TaxID=649831 RepID=UPI000329467F|nr:permease-like cell division protein FtsX [Actinoplanes sp. N902-109]AGL15804.1 hypothetical protein L083_2294 [Actinoplanes sp. N902-109]